MRCCCLTDLRWRGWRGSVQGAADATGTATTETSAAKNRAGKKETKQSSRQGAGQGVSMCWAQGAQGAVDGVGQSSGRLLLGCCCWWWWRDEGVTYCCPKAPAAARASSELGGNNTGNSRRWPAEIITSCRTPDSVRVVAGTDPSSSSTMSPHFSCAILASCCERGTGSLLLSFGDRSSGARDHTHLKGGRVCGCEEPFSSLRNSPARQETTRGSEAVLFAQFCKSIHSKI